MVCSAVKQVTQIIERSTDIIRAYQSKSLYDTHKMISLFIFRERISKSFENQVIATCVTRFYTEAVCPGNANTVQRTNYHAAIPLIVIFHDP